MKEYKLWELILYPSMQIMTGFFLSRRFGWAWDTVLVTVFLCVLSILTGIYILLGTLVQVMQIINWNTPESKREPVIVKTQFNQLHAATVGIKFDTERMFCKSLLEFENLTESYWLKGNPSKWQSIGGAGRSDFVKCKERLTRLGALERTNPQAANSPHRIADRRILQHRASRPTPN